MSFNIQKLKMNINKEIFWQKQKNTGEFLILIQSVIRN